MCAGREERERETRVGPICSSPKRIPIHRAYTPPFYSSTRTCIYTRYIRAHVLYIIVYIIIIVLLFPRVLVVPFWRNRLVPREIPAAPRYKQHDGITHSYALSLSLSLSGAFRPPWQPMATALGVTPGQWPPTRVTPQWRDAERTAAYYPPPPPAAHVLPESSHVTTERRWHRGPIYFSWETIYTCERVYRVYITRNFIIFNIFNFYFKKNI